ncbi:hypothetical protein SHKM778_51150 [Streptomyces sp. KM77-8]|uniref:FAD dependent oxidoreductase domain-containing protein n=1 Tax=Streptomyces haneummycinicus TaxID=3074435 RepID=A0AAT9HMF4_9ACTN
MAASAASESRTPDPPGPAGPPAGERPAFGEVGAGIQLAPNCTRILDDYGLLEEAKSLGVVPDSMVMRDAVDGDELTRIDLRDLEKRYGYPYLVIHRSDLHGLLLRACERAGVELINDAHATSYENTEGGARVTVASGETYEAGMVIAADGLHSPARKLFVDDQPVSSAYVAYRGTVPADEPRVKSVDLSEVVVYVGPGCHFVHYGLRGGAMLNQVAVFESPKALAGEDDWGTPTSSTPPSPGPASSSGTACPSCGGRSGGGCSTATRS